MKAILILEMPEKCDYCPLGRVFGCYGGVECTAMHRCTFFPDKRPDWCPLIALDKE